MQEHRCAARRSFPAPGVGACGHGFSIAGRGTEPCRLVAYILALARQAHRGQLGYTARDRRPGVVHHARAPRPSPRWRSLRGLDATMEDRWRLAQRSSLDQG